MLFVAILRVYATIGWLPLLNSTNVLFDIVLLQIADFGMARDVSDDIYYMSSGGKIPVKWTAPEVSKVM